MTTQPESGQSRVGNLYARQRQMCIILLCKNYSRLRSVKSVLSKVLLHQNLVQWHPNFKNHLVSIGLWFLIRCVVSLECCLSLEVWSLMTVVFHQRGGLSWEWSFTRGVVSHESGLSLEVCMVSDFHEWSFIRGVVSHESGLSLEGWSLMRVVSC